MNPHNLHNIQEPPQSSDTQHQSEWVSLPQLLLGPQPIPSEVDLTCLSTKPNEMTKTSLVMVYLLGPKKNRFHKKFIITGSSWKIVKVAL